TVGLSRPRPRRLVPARLLRLAMTCRIDRRTLEGPGIASGRGKLLLLRPINSLDRLPLWERRSPPRIRHAHSRPGRPLLREMSMSGLSLLARAAKGRWP